MKLLINSSLVASALLSMHYMENEIFTLRANQNDILFVRLKKGLNFKYVST